MRGDGLPGTIPSGIYAGDPQDYFCTTYRWMTWCPPRCRYVLVYSGRDWATIKAQSTMASALGRLAASEDRPWTKISIETLAGIPVRVKCSLELSSMGGIEIQHSEFMCFENERVLRRPRGTRALRLRPDTCSLTCLLYFPRQNGR